MNEAETPRGRLDRPQALKGIGLGAVVEGQ